MWLASWAVSLARELRLDDEIVIWHKSLAKLRQYQHAILRGDNQWTIEPEIPSDEYFDKLGVGNLTFSQK